MVQRKIFVPIESELTLELASEASVKVPVPEVKLQIPPVTAIAESVVEVAQIVWSVPALGESGLS